MAFKKTGRQEGFTIVEAALTLAIAGLIFLMMFVALPALQRQARDTERKEDISYLLKRIKDYQTNNRGALPTGDSEAIVGNEDANPNTWTGFYRDYLGNEFIDPSGKNYKLEILGCDGKISGSECGDVVNDSINKMNSNGSEAIGTIYIVKYAVCAGDELIGVKTSSNLRRVSVLSRMEQSGLYCANT